MSFSSAPLLFAILALIQVFGLLSTLLARISQGSSKHEHCQRLFLFALALVGSTAIAAVNMTSDTWLYSGVTLSVMILGTTWDFRRPEEAGSY